MHGTGIEEVHFHDVGAVDAIVDVTGACIGLHLLGVEAVHVSALPIGGGFVEGPHGRMPVPGPGTAELLRGFPVVDTGVRAELVTPDRRRHPDHAGRVGAGRMPAMTVDRDRLRRGHQGPSRHAQCAPLFVGETRGRAAQTETVAQLETTIDDMNPQLYEPADGSPLRGRRP